MFRNFDNNRSNNFKKEVKILKYLRSRMEEDNRNYITKLIECFCFHNHDFIVTKVYHKNLYETIP